MSISKIMLFSLISILSLLSVTCKNEVISVEENLEPGRRDYEWTVDTLNNASFTYLIGLWGSDNTNIWAVGHSDETIKSIWHYNGTWIHTNQRLSSNLISIWGYNNSIWTCDSPGGNIFKYDGTTWKSIVNFNKNNYELTYLNSIWGKSESEIYIAGSFYSYSTGTTALLGYFDDAIWKLYDLPELNVSFLQVRKSKQNNLFYLAGVEFTNNGEIYKIFSSDGSTLNELYSGVEVCSVNEMNGIIYICVGSKIYKHQNNNLEIWEDFSAQNNAGRLYGRNEKDFFTVSKNWELMHYNGNDLKVLYKPTTIFDVLLFEKDIYLLCHENTPFIVHGKLKEEQE
ncbi:MAG: hypothetical protein AUK34_12115 [Ignavibacteria bacterium CG2_30_36_16]|nr:MAG: hypothetical protein AUK34_12115 [Ignavibacteria bacterium CG2_30_36_16]PJA99704.1 MAG: hypothetical protein CO127_10000 [Ignavibacteria bacterium CG_4_9_14_3_um_filter_36_18]